MTPPGLLHPAALLAIVVVALNDHWAKYEFPGAVTGKLSDFAGLMWFPLLLVTIWELPRWLRGAQDSSRAKLLLCIAFTALVFSAINLHPAAADSYATAVGTLQWLPGAIASTLAGASLPARHEVAFTRDPTDLIALPSLFVAWYLGAARRPAAQNSAWA